eukprot:95477-Alexandrium_andersonii.AAC.1
MARPKWKLALRLHSNLRRLAEAARRGQRRNWAAARPAERCAASDGGGGEGNDAAAGYNCRSTRPLLVSDPSVAAGSPQDGRGGCPTTSGKPG